MNKATHQQFAELHILLLDFNNGINSEPDTAHIVTSPDGYKYIPIAYLEENLRADFYGLVQYEIMQTVELFNAVQCTARIRVFHPILCEWLNYDGVGTVIIDQLTSGKYADTVKALKVNDENIAAALAFAEAKKSAAKQIGVRYGSNLNRDIAPGKAAKTGDAITFNISDLKTETDILKAIASGNINADQASEIRIELGLKPSKRKTKNKEVVA